LNKTLLSMRCPSDSAEAGFSFVKLLFWLALIAFILINAASVAGAYYTNAQVQDTFEHLSSKMPNAAEPEIRAKMHEAFHVQYLDEKDLPDAFFDALEIHTTGHGFEISSLYHVMIWPLGRVETRDEHGEYDPEALAGLDSLKYKTRIDLRFEPYAISAVGNQ